MNECGTVACNPARSSVAPDTAWSVYSSQIDQHLAEKTHRGLRGRIEDGKSAGGLSYDYRVVETLNAGTVSTGERGVDSEQAAVVERIFRDFVPVCRPKPSSRH